jgi:hypothetical protein
MEDDLIVLFYFKEDNLNFFGNGRQPKKNNVTETICTWKIFENGR